MKKSETVDLNISVDQAIQWVVSCGVVIPPPPIRNGLLDWCPAAASGCSFRISAERWLIVAEHSRTLRLGTRGSLARPLAGRMGGRRNSGGSATRWNLSKSQRMATWTARPIEEIGTRGVFTKAIQDALLEGRVDIAVHSLKDLPTEPVQGLSLAAVPERESPADVLVLPTGGRSRQAGVSNICSPGCALGREACGGRRSCGMCGQICRFPKCAGTLIRDCGSLTRASSMQSCWQRQDCGGLVSCDVFSTCCHLI